MRVGQSFSQCSVVLRAHGCMSFVLVPRRRIDEDCYLVATRRARDRNPLCFNGPPVRYSPNKVEQLPAGLRTMRWRLGRISIPFSQALGILEGPLLLSLARPQVETPASEAQNARRRFWDYVANLSGEERSALLSYGCIAGSSLRTPRTNIDCPYLRPSDW